MTEERQRYVAEGVSVPVATDWLPTGLVPGPALTITEPWRPGHFAANVVLSVDAIPEGEPAPAWMDRAIDALPAQLDRLRVVDVEDATVDGRAGRRVLAHYPAEVGGVTVVQWLVPDGPRGIVLTCSSGTLAFDDVADEFDRIADGVRFVAEAS